MSSPVMMTWVSWTWSNCGEWSRKPTLTGCSWLTLISLPTPEKATQLLAETAGAERSPVGLVIRGFQQLFRAWGPMDAEAATAAVNDFRYVQFFFHDNPASLGFQLLALEAAINVARSEGRDADVARYSDAGRKLAVQLLKPRIIRQATGVGSDSIW